MRSIIFWAIIGYSTVLTYKYYHQRELLHNQNDVMERYYTQASKSIDLMKRANYELLHCGAYIVYYQNLNKKKVSTK